MSAAWWSLVTLMAMMKMVKMMTSGIEDDDESFATVNW